MPNSTGAGGGARAAERRGIPSASCRSSYGKRGRTRGELYPDGRSSANLPRRVSRLNFSTRGVQGRRERDALFRRSGAPHPARCAPRHSSPPAALIILLREQFDDFRPAINPAGRTELHEIFRQQCLYRVGAASDFGTVKLFFQQLDF